ncbi:MAG: hypothetical protein ACOC32_01790 [Nanoarchaeota archaeon]
MNTFLIFVWIYAAMIAMAFWEAYVEGRNSWAKKKLGWKFVFGKSFVVTGYHFFLFAVMFPLLLSLPLLITGWDIRLFGMLVSAYFSGMILEDFMWYVVNPEVKLKEFWTSFSDYYPWIRIGKKKIVPFGYLLNIGVAVLFWYLFWS